MTFPSGSQSRRLQRHRLRRGATLPETLILMAVLGVGAMGAFITAGTQLHRDYRASRTTLASPFP